MRALFRELTSSSVEDELAAEAGGQALGRQGLNQIADSEIENGTDSEAISEID